jgi:hypothetical protein
LVARYIVEETMQWPHSETYIWANF